LAIQIIKRWKKLAKHETFTAIMNAGIAYGAILGVLEFFIANALRFLVGLIFSLGFMSCIGAYFYWDYRKAHRRKKGKTIVEPLKIDVSKVDSIPKKQAKKGTIIKNAIFLSVETFEAIFFIFLPFAYWQYVALNGVPMITYDDMYMIGAFIFGVFLIIDIIRKMIHPRETMYLETTF
jgi:hypothetical protein